jgi:hypothetical protein
LPLGKQLNTSPAVQRIFTWFGNNAASDRGIKIPGFRQKVTFNSVAQSKMRAEIQEEAKRMAGGSEDSKKWLPHFPKARKIIIAQLSEEEREDIEAEVQKWKAEGIPANVQSE